MLRIGKISAGYLGVVNGYAELFDELAAAGDDRLCHAGYGAHSLGHESHTAAFGDDAHYLLDAVEVWGEVLLWNNARNL